MNSTQLSGSCNISKENQNFELNSCMYDHILYMSFGTISQIPRHKVIATCSLSCNDRLYGKITLQSIQSPIESNDDDSSNSIWTDPALPDEIYKVSLILKKG